MPTGIRADEKRLRQILFNLLSNAVKFTDLGEVILNVSSHAEAIASEDYSGFLNRQTLRFEVIDTGIGMNPQQLTTIF